MGITFSCRSGMDWTGVPLHLGAVQWLLDKIATKWCADNLPHGFLESTTGLMPALEVAFGLSKIEACLHVKKMILEATLEVKLVVQQWLDSVGITLPCYLSLVSNMGSKVDGLFIWILSRSLDMHFSVVYASGIWTLRCNAVPNLQDPVVVLTLSTVLAATTAGGDGQENEKLV